MGDLDLVRALLPSAPPEPMPLNHDRLLMMLPAWTRRRVELISPGQCAFLDLSLSSRTQGKADQVPALCCEPRT